MTRANVGVGLGLLGLVLLLGCGPMAGFDLAGCRDDNECQNNQVCFLNGCGDPGKNLVVEVTPNAKLGLFAQDIPVEELRDQQTLELEGSSTLKGQVLIKGRGGMAPSAYTERVTLRVTGESLLLPGVVRLQGDSTPPLDAQGAYSLSVGSGRYTVNLLTGNAELPPLSATREVSSGNTALLDFLLPSPEEVVRLSSRVLRADSQPVTGETPLEVQVVDAALLPITQRVPVSPDTGAFTLPLLRSALVGASLSLLVTSSNPLVPQVRFTLGGEPFPPAFLVADFGAPVLLRGRVLDAQGAPVAGATLTLSGQIEGGGLYRSSQVQSRLDGTFELLTLPSVSTGPSRELRLSIIPPVLSNAGSTELSVLVPRVSAWDVGEVRCQVRRQISGTVSGPGDEGVEGPLPGIQVEANLLRELPNVPRSATPRVAAPRRTDDLGRYTLALDPGVYRFDFVSRDNRPRFSRIVTVRSASESQDVSAVLPKGRLITGTVRYTNDPSGRPFIPNAGLRFFRQVSVEGQPSALLLGETTTDAQGAFSTTLPLP